MNTILQKRIEEAANTTVQNLYDYAKQTRNPKVSAYSEGYLDAIDVQGDFLFREGANYALSNQWISVEEALPEEKYLVLTRVKTPVGIVHRSDYYINDYWYKCRYNQEEIVTHWALIPSLEGGEK